MEEEEARIKKTQEVKCLNIYDAFKVVENPDLYKEFQKMAAFKNLAKPDLDDYIEFLKANNKFLKLFHVEMKAYNEQIGKTIKDLDKANEYFTLMNRLLDGHPNEKGIIRSEKDRYFDAGIAYALGQLNNPSKKRRHEEDLQSDALNVISETYTAVKTPIYNRFCELYPM